MWGSSGFRSFLGQKELKTPNVWSEPLRRSEPVFNWYSSPKNVDDIFCDIQSPELGDGRIITPYPTKALPSVFCEIFSLRMKNSAIFAIYFE
jgi:hypothetical protein